MLKKFLLIIQVSRIYQWPLFGLIALYGFAVSGGTVNVTIIILAVLFSFPLQLCLNGINDIYDRDTDALSDRKKHWIMGVRLAKKDIPLVLKAVAVSTSLILVSAAFLTNPIVFLLVLSGLVLGFAYSVPPIRTKERPLLCMLTYYYGYLCIVLAGFYAGINTGITPDIGTVVTIASNSLILPPLQPIILGLGPVGFAALSFVLDTKADKKAGLTTISTRYGDSFTLIITALCFGILSYWFGLSKSWGITAYLLITTLLSLLAAVSDELEGERDTKLPFLTMIWMFVGAVLILGYKIGERFI